MGEKLDDDVLGLSLSLSLGGSALKVNYMQQSVDMMKNDNIKMMMSSSWKNDDLFHPLPSGRTSNSDARSFLGGIDMNSAPSEAAVEPVVPDDDDDDKDNGDNSTVSSSSGKRSEREEANELDEEDGGGSGEMRRKKLRLTKEQSMLLEETFKQHNTLNPKQKEALAKELSIRARQVEVWFQNRRARTKLKQSEVDCEYLKRCCENLSEENRRLHKEVQELRTLKLSPQLYMHMNPPTTLTMCPSCERVATLSSSSTAHSAALPQPPSNCSHLLGPNNGRPAVPVNPWPFKGSISRP